MALDGIVLKSLVKEFNEKLINGHIQKIYQINEHILILKKTINYLFLQILKTQGFILQISNMTILLLHLNLQ